MNIYAIRGHRVKFTHPTAGYQHDQDLAKLNLKINTEYAVERTIVHSSSTDVQLVEFPGLQFNSVMFEDIEPQSKDDDKKHADYSRYHQ